MKTILKPGYEKIFFLFYSAKSTQFHLREIARQTKLNENSVSRFLHDLEKEKVLFSRKESNLKKYGLQKNDIVYSLLAYFDILRLQSLPHIRQEAIFHFSNHLPEKPYIIILFGSTAKRTFRENSDIDILLIVNRRISTKEAERYVDAQTGLRMQCLQITMKDFKYELKLKQDHVVQAALRTGFPLTNHIEWYRVMTNERI